VEFDQISCEACLSPIKYTHTLRFSSWLTTGPQESWVLSVHVLFAHSSCTPERISTKFYVTYMSTCQSPTENNQRFSLSVSVTTGPLVSHVLGAVICALVAKQLHIFFYIIWVFILSFVVAGMPVSQGVVRGPARIVLSLADAHMIQVSHLINFGFFKWYLNGTGAWFGWPVVQWFSARLCCR
jgi:hypothetical protein